MSHLVGLGHLTDDLPSGGVNGWERLPADGVLPFVVDEQLSEAKTKTLFSRRSWHINIADENLLQQVVGDHI